MYVLGVISVCVENHDAQSGLLLHFHPNSRQFGADQPLTKRGVGCHRQGELEQRLHEPRTNKEALWTAAGRQEARFLRFLRTRNKADDYETIKLIGKGAFGEVKLVRKHNDGKIYALKSLVKTAMIAGDQVARVRAERDILAESDSPWVVKLFTTFQDTKYLYMLMEFLPGGDLMTMLIKYDIFSEDITRFYIAEIIMAIEAVHKLEFIHRYVCLFVCLPCQSHTRLNLMLSRDIKPDNILLDRGGHVKLTDFGLSTGFRKLHDNKYYKQLLNGGADAPGAPSRNSQNFNRYSVNIDQISLTVSNRAQINEWRKSRRLMAYSAVGTPDYIAPEILTGQGYSFDCDWVSTYLGSLSLSATCCGIEETEFSASSGHSARSCLNALSAGLLSVQRTDRMSIRKSSTGNSASIFQTMFM